MKTSTKEDLQAYKRLREHKQMLTRKAKPVKAEKKWWDE